MSIKEMDQSNWVCYKLPEESYYYGEVGLLDNSGVVHPKDNVQLAGDAKLVKHGFGIYIYQDPQGKIKYQGNFQKGYKCGKGKLFLTDGSFYEGQFRQDQYHDSGVMNFANGDIYDGKWKKGRMQGPGLFKRKSGQILKGSFKNNYFLDGKVLRNPFLSDEDYEKLKKKRKELQKQYQKNQKAKNGYFERVSSVNFNAIISLLEKSWKNNRIPLLFGSQQAQLSISSLSDILSSASKTVKIADLRKFYKLDGQNRYNYKKQISENVQKCMIQGHYLVLSLDDSVEVTQFDQFFYPEIKQLYQPNGLNQSIWSPQGLHKPEICEKIIQKEKIHENFGFLVWSKIKLSQTDISDGLIQEKIQKRFQSILPYIKIDLIFLNKEDKPEDVVPPEN